MITIERLTRCYGEFVAVDNVSFHVDHGEVAGLLGHNGAGKTTIMKMLTGFLEPTTGIIRVDGLEMGKATRAIQAGIGYLPENCPPEAAVNTDEAEASSKSDDTTDSDEGTATDETPGPITSVIERSPESARVILVASNTFADDAVLNLASEGLGTLYTQPVEFLQNAIDWSLEDRGLLAIRSRAQFARTLTPMERSDQLFWEYLNYGLAILGLAVAWIWRRSVRRADEIRYQSILAEV